MKIEECTQADVDRLSFDQKVELLKKIREATFDEIELLCKALKYRLVYDSEGQSILMTNFFKCNWHYALECKCDSCVEWTRKLDSEKAK